MITQEKLKELLHYNPETGKFTRLVGGHGRRVGEMAGTIDSYGYVQIKIRKKCYRAHRLAWLYMTGMFPKECTDHINNIRNDNRWCNLREASYKENKLNSKVKSNCKLKVKGVEPSGKKFIARASFNNKKYYLGTFSTISEASRKYKKFCKEYHGEFCFDA
jgi:hypothetical protein